MRRCSAVIAAAALVLAVLGTATAAEGDGAPAPSAAPIVEPTPTPAPSVGPTAEPSASPAPTADPSVGPTDPVDPAPSAGTSPQPVPSRNAAPVVAAPTRPATRPAGLHASATDPVDRWIVVLNAGVDPRVAADRQGRRLGFTSDRTYGHALRGYSARMDRATVTALSRDPSVAMIVADERIELTSQAIPTGILRVNATRSPSAAINGVDVRVDADVAIVDTGIASVTDLNVAGGYNCSTSNRAAWRDVYGHGTHVAGTVGAIDNGTGVVGVAPGVRLWAVKILDDTGEGLLSWYVCGLDWIAAQRDPSDPTRPLFEAVNMSVAKWGSDDLNCGATNGDILHAAICRLVASGVTVVAAAGNDSSSAAARVPAAYNEVITVSALADTDGKPGGLGGNKCFSWGTYDQDDTFADFSNRGSDVDLIAPGKCIWSTVPGGYRYSSGTSMAAPHVTGAVALLKATRPGLTPGEVREALVYLGSDNWKRWTDPDGKPDKLLDVSRIGPRGTFTLGAGPQAFVGKAGGAARFAITATRSATSFERIRLSATDLPDGWTAGFDASSLYGFTGVATAMTVTVPSGMAPGSYPVTVVGDEHGNRQTATAIVVVETDLPTALPPAAAIQLKSTIGISTVLTRITWPAASDPTTGIAGYELQRSIDGGSWTTIASTAALTRSTTVSQLLGHAYAYRVRARDLVGNWGDWAPGAGATGALIQDRWTVVAYSGKWTRVWSSYASGGTRTWTTQTGAKATLRFGGRGIAIAGQTAVGRGSAAVYVDGIYRTTISFRASTYHDRVVLFSTTFPTLGTHTIVLRAAGNGRIDLDAFVILR